MSRAARRPPWLLGVVLLLGAGLVAGGFSVLDDQRTGTPGAATMKECQGGRKYDPGIRCTGTWQAGGAPVAGRIEGAGYGDVGKTIDVRVHGSGHATKPSLGTPIVLWALGAPFAALAPWGLVAWWRQDHVSA